MPVIIRIRDIEAVVIDKIWKTDDEVLQAILNYTQLPRNAGYIPWPDYTLAEMACKALGGKIIEATDPPEYIPGRVY